MFRQNRDIRFSADKSPYKTNTYGVLRGTDTAAQGLYASISADGLVAGSGYHVMARDQLERFREGVADDRHGPELAKLAARAEQAGLELWGQSLATAPRGYRGPRADRAVASQEPVTRRQTEVRARDQPRRWAAVRDQDLACRCARDRLARRARRRHDAASRETRSVATLAPGRLRAECTPTRSMRRSRFWRGSIERCRRVTACAGSTACISTSRWPCARTAPPVRSRRLRSSRTSTSCSQMTSSPPTTLPAAGARSPAAGRPCSTPAMTPASLPSSSPWRE